MLTIRPVERVMQMFLLTFVAATASGDTGAQVPSAGKCKRCAVVTHKMVYQDGSESENHKGVQAAFDKFGVEARSCDDGGENVTCAPKVPWAGTSPIPVEAYCGTYRANDTEINNARGGIVNDWKFSTLSIELRGCIRDIVLEKFKWSYYGDIKVREITDKEICEGGPGAVALKEHCPPLNATNIGQDCKFTCKAAEVIETKRAIKK
jgi:hypothetical protein